MRLRRGLLLCARSPVARERSACTGFAPAASERECPGLARGASSGSTRRGSRSTYDIIGLRVWSSAGAGTTYVNCERCWMWPQTHAAGLPMAFLDQEHGVTVVRAERLIEDSRGDVVAARMD